MDSDQSSKLMDMDWPRLTGGVYRFVSFLPEAPLNQMWGVPGWYEKHLPLPRSKPELVYFGHVNDVSDDVYYPLQISGLCRMFADLDPESPTEISDFATRWGVLTNDDNQPLEYWQREIVEMRTAFFLWEGIKTQDVSGLAKGWSGMISELQKVLDYKKEMLEVFESHGPALRTLGFLFEHFLLFQMKDHPSEMFAFFNESGSSSRIEHSIAPYDLIGALWLQFSLHASGDAEYRRCAVCDEIMEISSGQKGFQKNRRYCSDKCRQKAFRMKRVKEAIGAK